MLLIATLASLAHADTTTLPALAAADDNTFTTSILNLSLGWETFRVVQEAQLGSGARVRTALTCEAGEAREEATCELRIEARAASGAVLSSSLDALLLAHDGAGRAEFVAHSMGGHASIHAFVASEATSPLSAASVLGAAVTHLGWASRADVTVHVEEPTR